MAFLAPDVPRALADGAAEVLPEPLAAVVADRLAYNRALAIIGRYSLVDGRRRTRSGCTGWCRR